MWFATRHSWVKTAKQRVGLLNTLNSLSLGSSYAMLIQSDSCYDCPMAVKILGKSNYRRPTVSTSYHCVYWWAYGSCCEQAVSPSRDENNNLWAQSRQGSQQWIQVLRQFWMWQLDLASIDSAHFGAHGSTLLLAAIMYVIYIPWRGTLRCGVGGIGAMTTLVLQGCLGEKQ